MKLNNLSEILSNFICFHQETGEKLSEIGGRLNFPRLNKELAHEIEALWRDTAIQVSCA